MKLLRILTLLLVVMALPLSAQAKIFLADTDDTLRVVTASGVSTIHMYAAWADITTTALTPGASDAQVTTATTTVLVAAPGASTQRQIKGLTIANSHASSSNVVTVEFFDGATATRLIAYTLLAGETLQWNEDVGFRVLDASGQLKGAMVADTEMPAAQSLSGNNIAYPTSAPLVGAVLLCDDGAALDKCQGGLTDTDDNSIAFSQVPGLVVNIPYVSNGTTWERQRKSVYAEDAAHTDGDTGVAILSRRIDTLASSAGTSADYATVNTDQLGRLYTRDANPCSDYSRITHAVISESTAATNEIVALNGSDLIYVCSYKWVTTAANSLNWTRGTGTDCATGTTAIEGAQPFAANGGVAESGGGHPLFVVPAGNALCLVSSAATAHGGRVSYVRTATP